jgi:hypothetical protein
MERHLLLKHHGCFVLFMTAINNWTRKLLDFIQGVEKKLYITSKIDDKEWAVQVLNNIYGQWQAGNLWFDLLTEGLKGKLGFKQRDNDQCIVAVKEHVY